jgi:Zn-dependent protease with chaperone function
VGQYHPKATPDEMLLVFGHESGHYVLHHIVRRHWLCIVLLLVTLYLGYLFVQWAIAKFGPKWKRSLADRTGPRWRCCCWRSRSSA